MKILIGLLFIVSFSVFAAPGVTSSGKDEGTSNAAGKNGAAVKIENSNSNQVRVDNSGSNTEKKPLVIYPDITEEKKK